MEHDRMPAATPAPVAHDAEACLAICGLVADIDAIDRLTPDAWADVVARAEAAVPGIRERVNRAPADALEAWLALDPTVPATAALVWQDVNFGFPDDEHRGDLGHGARVALGRRWRGPRFGESPLATSSPRP